MNELVKILIIVFGAFVAGSITTHEFTESDMIERNKARDAIADSIQLVNDSLVQVNERRTKLIDTLIFQLDTMATRTMELLKDESSLSPEERKEIENEALNYLLKNQTE